MEGISFFVDHLGYSEIEDTIAERYGLGVPDQSELPGQFAENESGCFSIICSKGRGMFNIRVHKQKENYCIVVSPLKIKKAK